MSEYENYGAQGIDQCIASIRIHRLSEVVRVHDRSCFFSDIKNEYLR